MISKKKKSVHLINLSIQPILQQSSLFSPKAQKQHLLDELKKGTLFNFYPKKDNHALNAQTGNPSREDNDWLSHIRLGVEEEESHNLPTNNHLCKTAPHSKHFPTIQSKTPKLRKSNFVRSNRCGKLVCYEKKLQMTGAWNKQNPNNIEQNITQLANRHCQNYEQLVSHDFKRVGGLQFNDRSFEESIQQLVADSSICASPAFQNLSFMNTFHGTGKMRDKSSKRLIGSLRKRKEGEGHFVPGFLLESILLEREKKASKR